MPWCITRAVGGPPHAPSEGSCPLAPPDPRERGGGAKLGSSHGAFGLAWTRTGGFVSFNSTNVRKVAITEPDVVIHHACGRWAATRVIGGHVSSGTSRPSRASFGRSQIAPHGLVWTRTRVLVFRARKTAKVVSYDADPVVSQACGRCSVPPPTPPEDKFNLRHLRYPRERVGGAISDGSRGAHGLGWTQIASCNADAVVHHACGRWAANHHRRSCALWHLPALGCSSACGRSQTERWPHRARFCLGDLVSLASRGASAR